ncbi:putative lipid II flippase FtsW [Marinobacterium sp. D7]|uniref:putative lipid II flippase FtsW n=1 Tax=Marinobacterium ramblicola TaxID=2849041 RepID=UPI001C2D0171|nr:putative lipid II flippase FtsW [Marinobacterium ramblicola]MBV1787088.1 putative lipid II flippase FtsW [Marinobacterium ramblicola]
MRLSLSLPKVKLPALPPQLLSRVGASTVPAVPKGILPFDPWLLLSTVALVLIGFIMITSASMDVAAKNFGSAGFFIVRHGSFMLLSLIGALIAVRVPVQVWEKYSVPLLFIGLALLILVLIPGIGREVNGSRRWIGLGPVNLQASEIAKVCMVLFMGGYLVRRLSEVRSSWWGVIKPAFPLALYMFVLILEPDYGATVVLVGTVMGMIFLGGMRPLQFFILVGVAGSLVGALAGSQSYRMERLKSFTDPWADPYGSGYQLSQAQIAFGRGEWFGTGLGNSVQKLFYLPEAHTDFVYSVLAEEFGIIGALIVCALYALLVARIFLIGRQAEKQKQFFMAYISYGFAFIIAGQAMINIGVNVGALPTKGLTLPLLSYGGSSLLVCCGMIAIVQRVDYELKRMRLGLPLAGSSGKRSKAEQNREVKSG